MLSTSRGGSTTATMPYPAPPSPTLTNPDMILPYGEYDSTPSPPQHPTYPNNANGGWKGGPDELDFQLGLPIGTAIGPMTPTTPIIYGNGTMLSDIGEVTEAESISVKRPITSGTRKVHIQKRNEELPTRLSPTVGYEALTKRSKFGSHQRQVSIESTSTIRTAEEQSGQMHFEDFDDGVSVDDSNFQGDDEESVADESYETQVAVAQAAFVSRKDSVKQISPDEDTSSAALSRRAELILANAKKRLDNMEGNLTRARSSLYITPSSSMSSIHSSSPLSRSTPSPPNNAQRIHPQLGILPARHRQLNKSYPTPNSSPGHQRISSENSLPSPASQTSPSFPQSLNNTGAARSANDDQNPDSYGFDSSIDTQRRYKASPLGDSRSGTPLQTSSEDDATPLRDTFHGERSATAEPFLHPQYEHHILTRSSSSMQMRDLTDKMKDLKGKISTLRDRAREDNMKRRSLQSLRTPSPFTAAESWYTSSKAYKAGLVADAGVLRSPWNGEPSEVGQEDMREDDVVTPTADDQKSMSEAPSVYEDVPEIAAAEEEDAAFHEEEDHHNEENHRSIQSTADPAEEGFEDFEEIEPEEVDDRSESSASQYHDTVQAPVSHEDREDAFDYEHFFLHSAMGTISQQRMNRRDSVTSYSSEDSVITARGPSPVKQLPQGDSRTARGHLKNQKSTDSVSTMNTFATATEGYAPDEDTIPEDEDSDSANHYDGVLSPVKEERNDTPTSKRSTFGSPAGKGSLDEKENQLDGKEHRAKQWVVESESRPSSAPHNNTTAYSSPDRPGAGLHRPSVSSFASSTGTTRSFPLVNRPKTSASLNRNYSPIPSPTTSTTTSEPQQDTKPSKPIPGSVTAAKERAFSAMSALHGNTSNTTLVNGHMRSQDSPVAGLEKGDQFLVERLVASLGKCVLGLQDEGRGSVEGRMWRRRLEVARRVLDGEGGV